VRFVSLITLAAALQACGGESSRSGAGVPTGDDKTGGAGLGGGASLGGAGLGGAGLGGAGLGGAGLGGSAGLGDGAGLGGGAGLRNVAGAAGASSFVPNHGCQSRLDCSQEQACLQYTPNGPADCVTPAVPTTTCNASNLLNQCCTSTDCSVGACFLTEVFPTGPCGLGGVSSYNECLSDACQVDGDCLASQLCLPAGFGPVRKCMIAACRADSDCTAESGGACVVFRGGCCSGNLGGPTTRAQQLACAYPSDGCQSDSDCAQARTCVVSAGRAHCADTCQ
jgi:hypothetical protein